MKKVIDVEKLDLGEMVKKGLSVRDQVVQEFKDARIKMAQVNWQNELETFRKNPLDTAQGYLNQVSEALKGRMESQTETKTPAPKSVAKKPAAKKSTAKKTTGAKSPRTTKAKTTTTRRKKTSRAKKTTTQTKS